MSSPRRVMKRLRPAALILALALGMGATGAWAQVPDGADEPAALRPEYPAQELTGQILYQMMLAEISGARGYGRQATQSYIDLARRTRDPRIARRAAEMAVIGRQAELLTEAAQVWLDLEPTSVQAQQLAAGAVLDDKRARDVQEQLAKALARQGDRIGTALLALNRGLAQISDKAQIRRLVEALTEPYLKLPEAHFARANAAFVAGDQDGALAALEEALKLNPDWEQAVVLKAQMLQPTRPALAQQTLAAYLERHPEARDPRLVLGRLLVADRQFPQARQQFERALSYAPEDREILHAAGLLAMQQGDLKLAEAHLRKLLQLGYADADTVHIYLGQIAEASKRPADALAEYRDVKGGEQFFPAQERIAQLLVNMGRLPEARQHLQALAARGGVEQVRYVLAEASLLRDNQQQAEAVAVLERALADAPESPELLYESALMAEREGRLEVMEGRLRKLIALKPEHAHAYNALGYSLAERGLRLEEAEGLIRQGLELAPKDPFIMDSLGWVQYRRGDLNGALASLQAAYTLRADPEIAAHLGEVLWKLERKDEARQLWQQALKANPGHEVLQDVIRKFKP
ncbi:MAG: tetratricopeptide repeat protein [Zoogloea sp.]|uniref:tetratricopeptide repeat protein n=1 Tax=Zoogloea sp. TaxID=49181 RepID=UPI003F331001